jgi:hypothetical protein
MTINKLLSAACTAAVLICIPAGISYAGQATSFGAVGAIGYADVDYSRDCCVKEETAVAAGGAIGFVRVDNEGGDPATGNVTASWNASATANGETQTSGVATLGGSHGDGDGDADCGCGGATASSRGSLSVSADSGTGGTTSNNVE